MRSPRGLATPPDIAGEWVLQSNEDPGQIGGQGQPTLGYYLGIPFNEAGRMRADTSAESIWGTPEYQCRPHSAPHQWRGLGGARILKEEDPLTRDINAYHIQFMRSLDWPIYMDGRPHPPAWAPHTWTGFSTGEWVGNTLKITTTHLKDGYLRRAGPQTSDMYTMTDFITRHGDTLTAVTVIDDPIYQDEPFIQSTTYQVDINATTNWETCNASSFAENGGTNRHWVPHFLPGQNTALTEWLKNEKWIPEEPTRGGVKTIYPEYKSTLNGSVKVADLKVPASKSAVNVRKAIADQSPKDGEVHVLPVQGNIYMLIADGTNITVSVGSRRRADGEHRHGGDVGQDPGGGATEWSTRTAGAESLLRRELSRARLAGPVRSSTTPSVRRRPRSRCATSSTQARLRRTSAEIRRSRVRVSFRAAADSARRSRVPDGLLRSSRMKMFSSG